MQLSKFDYYSDYVAYPVIIACLAGHALIGQARGDQWVWLRDLALGVVVWSLLEYLLHRFVLHKIPYFMPMHGLHHTAPLSYVGTPTWISLATYVGAIFAPAYLLFGFNAASGFFAGVTAGYVWYGALHHLIHHRAELARLPYLRRLRADHLRHHYARRAGNFGVTTAIWDRLFGTSIRAGAGAAAPGGR